MFRNAEAGHIRRARQGGLRTEAKEYLGVLRQDPQYQDAAKLVMLDRWEQLARDVPEFTREEWERAGRVFSGLNNGVKAALFLAIAQETIPGTYMPVEDIVDRFEGVFGGTELLTAFGGNTKKNVIQYCQDSLCGVGLLATEYGLEEQLIGFGVTHEGLDYGIPVAMQTVWFENKTNQPLYPILGRTSTSGETRPPFNRSRILDFLARHPYGLRDIDLENALRLHSIDFGKTLEFFRTLELVEYQATTAQTGKTTIRYETIPGQDLARIPYIKRGHAVQDFIVGAINQQPNGRSFSRQDVTDWLSEDLKKRWKNGVLRKRVNEILGGLAKHGGLKRVDEFKGFNKQSDITLTPKGREIAVEFIWPVLYMVSRKPLKQQQETAMEKVRDNLPTMARRSAELYYPHSESSKRREWERNKAKLKEALIKSTKPLTIKDISEMLGLHPRTIFDYLSPKMKDSSEIVFELDGQVVVIEREKIKGVWYYRLKQPTAETAR